jgi:hypothetical protein
MTDVGHNGIEFDGETFNVDAALISDGLRVEAPLLLALMREGLITGRCERGMDQDAGRYRLTFYYDKRSVRLTVDEKGDLIEREISPG